MSRFPKLEIVSSFGVGYDHIDAKWAGEHGIIVTNTPDVLERGGRRHRAWPAALTVRDCRRRSAICAPGQWPAKGDYPLTATLRDRTVGIVGMGRIGKAIARRLEALRCRWSITRAGRRTCPTGTIRT